jgi:hypothetical protein
MAIWFKSFANLRDHPKLFLFASVLGVNDVEALGYIHLFLGFVCSYAEDGGLKKFPDSTIEKVCKWAGPPGQFIKALNEAGFVENTPEGRIVHDWWKENGGHIQDAERKRQSRIMANRVRGLSADGHGNVLLTDRQTDIHTDKEGLRDSIKSAVERFVALRAAQSAYMGISYDPGDRGRATATNLFCGPKPPTPEEFEHAATNFFASDGNFTFHHAAHSFFGNFHSWLAGQLNRGGTGAREGNVKDGHERGQSGGVRAGHKNAGSGPSGPGGKGNGRQGRRGEGSLAGADPLGGRS